MTILIKGGTVVTADEHALPAIADILIEGNRISAIAPNIEANHAEVIDAAGALVMPGLIDTHTHSWQHAFTGGLVRGKGFLDYVAKFELYRVRFSAEDARQAVRGCSLAQLDAGVTGVIDFVHGANHTPEHVQAMVEAHSSTGQRTLMAIGNTGAVNGAADPKAFEASRQQRLEIVEQLARSNSDSLVRAGLALLTPTAEHTQRVLDEIDFGRTLGLQMSVHQNRPGEISMLHEAGRLGPDLVVVHSNTANVEEIETLAETATALSSTPESEVGAGWSPHIMRRALRRGVNVGLGIDTPSTQPVDLWQQIRVLMLLMNALDSEAARQVGRYPIDSKLDSSTLSYERALQTATRGGAHCLRGSADELGVLVPGAIADVIVVRPNNRDVALHDPAPYLVQYGSASQVETVVVDGVVRKKNYSLVDVDVDELAAANRAVRNRVMMVEAR